MERSKLKSRSHHDTAHLRPLTNVIIKYPFPTTSDFRDIAKTRFKGQGHRSNQGHTMTLHSYTAYPCPYQVLTSYTLQFPRYRPDKMFKLKATTARSKVKKSGSHHDIVHLHLLTNVPTKNQTSYTLRFLRYRADMIFKLKVTTARSKVKPMPLPRIVFPHLTVPEIQPRQTFCRHPPTHPNAKVEKISTQTLKAMRQIFENFNYLNVAFKSYKLTMWDWMVTLVAARHHGQRLRKKDI